MICVDRKVSRRQCLILSGMYDTMSVAISLKVHHFTQSLPRARLAMPSFKAEHWDDSVPIDQDQQRGN